MIFQLIGAIACAAQGDECLGEKIKHTAQEAKDKVVEAGHRVADYAAGNEEGREGVWASGWMPG